MPLYILFAQMIEPPKRVDEWISFDNMFGFLAILLNNKTG